MIQVIHSTEHKARHKYPDDGYDYINDWINYGCYTGDTKLTFAEWRSVAQFKQSNTQQYILPGEKYVRQFNVMDGETYTFKMKIDLFKLAYKLKLFME